MQAHHIEHVFKDVNSVANGVLRVMNEVFRSLYC